MIASPITHTSDIYMDEVILDNNRRRLLKRSLLADDVGYDVTVVDTQLLSRFQERTGRQVIVCGENAAAHTEPCTDACE